jgi:ubiquinone/menaquinone biosynthesis C-methylase UbiE
VVDVGCGAGYFTLPLAEIVGGEGRVLALDIQEEMLAIARRRAERRGMDANIEFRRCDPHRLGLKEPMDFVLAFWMAHEVSDPRGFLQEIKGHLKPDGALLIVEPKVHVPRHRFEDTADLARAAGFQVDPGPRVFFSRTIVCSASTSPPG